MRNPFRAVWRKLRSLEHEEFANWSAGAQSLAVAIGVIVGGIWTWHLFDALQQKDNAAGMLLRNQAELQTLRLGFEKAQEESRRAYGLLTLTTTPVKTDRRTGLCYMQVNVKVSNAANREIRLWFFGDSIYPPLDVARVRIDREHQFHFTPVAHVDVHTFTPMGDSVFPMVQSSLQPGESSTYPFLVRVPNDGLYLVQFKVPVDTARVNPGGEPPPPDSLWFWTARTYVSGCSATAGVAAEPERVR